MTGAAKTLLGTFVVVFVLTVGIFSVGALVLDDGTPTTEVEHEHIDSSLIADQAADGGEIAMASTEPQNTIVIHTGQPQLGGFGMMSPVPIHDGDTDRQLSVGSMGGPERDVTPLASALVENGHEVVYYEDEREDGPLAENLEDADAFVTLGTASFSTDERETIDEFADAGGRTLIAADPGSSNDIGEIAAGQGLYAEAGYLYNLVENDNNYLGVYTEATGDSPLTEGVDRAVFRGAAPIGSSQGTTIMETAGDETRLSTTREKGSYAVAAVSDDVAMIGDSSFMTPENAHRADNDVLVSNVADFLVSGDQPAFDAGDDEMPGGEFPDEDFEPPE